MKISTSQATLTAQPPTNPTPKVTLGEKVDTYLSEHPAAAAGAGFARGFAKATPYVAAYTFIPAALGAALPRPAAMVAGGVIGGIAGVVNGWKVGTPFNWGEDGDELTPRSQAVGAGIGAFVGVAAGVGSAYLGYAMPALPAIGLAGVVITGIVSAADSVPGQNHNSW